MIWCGPAVRDKVSQVLANSRHRRAAGDRLAVGQHKVDGAAPIGHGDGGRQPNDLSRFGLVGGDRKADGRRGTQVRLELILARQGLPRLQAGG